MDIVVRQHKGRSGKSVYGWRVYTEWLQNGVKKHRNQHSKHRTQEGAERSAQRLRDTLAANERTRTERDARYAAQEARGWDAHGNNL